MFVYTSVFQSGCTNLHFHQQRKEFPIIHILIHECEISPNDPSDLSISLSFTLISANQDLLSAPQAIKGFLNFCFLFLSELDFGVSVGDYSSSFFYGFQAMIKWKQNKKPRIPCLFKPVISG